jgi:hypothetical protein
MLHQSIGYLDACRWLEKWEGLLEEKRELAQPSPLSSNGPSLQVVQHHSLRTSMWLDYVLSRGISLSLATNYLSEVQFAPYGAANRLFWGIGWQGRNGKWHIRTKLQHGPKRSEAPSDITVIEVPGSSTLLIFEGMFDFLSFLVISKRVQPIYTSVILNSTAHIDKAMQLMEHFAYVRLYLDNDAAGSAATAAVLSARPDAVDCRNAYAAYNDINDLLIK